MKKLKKKLWIMSRFFLFVSCLQALFITTAVAGDVHSQNLKSVTIDFSWENVRLEEVFQDLQDQTDYFFTYDRNAIRKIRISAANTHASLADLLFYVSGKTGLHFSVKGENILVYQGTYEPKQQVMLEIPAVTELSTLVPDLPYRVIYDIPQLDAPDSWELKGKITDTSGEPLIGATVVIEETGSGTTTDVDGNFSLFMPEDKAYTLLVNYLGHEPQNIEVSAGQTDLLIALEESISELNEVVVVGYGQQQKSDITGSVSSVSEKRMDLVPNRNLAQVLQGAVPGLVVRQTSAGAEGETSILIRGQNSILASNDPLLVVDGVPYYGNLNDLNVSDIESIEVLKDASAAAIYGSRGSNGVILVTTKSGEVGKAVIGYKYKYGLQKPINLPEFLNGREFYEFKQERDANLITDTEQYNYENGIETNWIDLSLRDGSSQSHDLSVSGGSEMVNYYVSGNLLDVKGLSITDNYKRMGGRANLEVKVTDWLTFGTRNQFTYDDRSGYNIDYEAIFEMNPLTGPAFNEDGSLNLYPWPEFPDENPLEAQNYIDEDYGNQLVSNNYFLVKFPFAEGLSYRLNTGIRRGRTDKKIYAGQNTTLGIANSGYAYLSNAEVKNNVMESILSYDRHFGKHHLFLTGVYSFEERERESQELEATNFPNDEFTYFGISQAANVISDNDYYRTALISQMLRVNYVFDNKYLLTFTGRRDGYSGFGPDNKWGFFPSVALGWNMTHEGFMANSSLLSQLKLRLSWGINGNQAVDPYSSITRLSERSSLSGDSPQVGYIPSVIGDSELGWESSETINLGLDFGFFNNRLQGDLNVYQTETSDLLLNRTISSVHGINEITQNIGKTQTRGIELSLMATALSAKDFRWKIAGNLAANKNKILSLYGAIADDGSEIDDIANSWFIGQPIRVNYDYRMIGVWQLNEAETAELYDREPGAAKIEDVNGDGVINADDRQIIGQVDPKFTWGMSNTFDYKNFSLEIFLIGSHGATRQNNILRDNTAAELRRNVYKKNWWRSDNPTNEYYANAGFAGGVSIYEDASFIRVKDVTLSYNVPVSKIGFNRLQLFVTGRNLLTITNWSGGDPELNLPSDLAGILPLQKEYTFGVSLQF